MLPTWVRLTSRTTYRGPKGSGAGRSSKTSARSSPASRQRSTALAAQLAGRTFKASQRGLYHGVLLQSGNNVPKSRQKTARTFRPNVQRKRLWSELLQQHVQCRVTTRAFRTIRKHGGLDAYVARTDDALLGQYGRDLADRMAWALRFRNAAAKGSSPPDEAQMREVQEQLGALRVGKAPSKAIKS